MDYTKIKAWVGAIGACCIFLIGCASTAPKTESTVPTVFDFNMNAYKFDIFLPVDFGNGSPTFVALFTHPTMGWDMILAWAADGSPLQAIEKRAEGFCLSGPIGSTALARSDQSCVVINDLLLSLSIAYPDGYGISGQHR